MKVYKPRDGGAWEFYGKSTEEMPDASTIETGAILYLMDTHQIFVFDSDTRTWVVQ